MKIEFAHLQHQATTGEMVDFAVFFAQANSDTDAARDEWLGQLIVAARAAGRKVDAAALVYKQGNEIKWWGHPFVVDYLNKFDVPPSNYYVQF